MKSVTKMVQSQWQSEGRGARVRRSIGRQELRNLDPFLLLDEFEGNSKDGAGFPDHPHRGFETVSYLLEGEFTHEDFAGNRGVLRPGDLQWMTAGRGVVHSEMPGPVRTRGLQLWVNLASTDKMVEPAYQELPASQIPEASEGGASVRVIAGTSMGVSSQVRTRTPTLYLDFRLAPGARHTQEVEEGWTAFLYTLAGVVRVGEAEVGTHTTALLTREGGAVTLENSGTEEEAHLILVAGRPLGEPIVQHGPFVMNTEAEIRQAIRDYQTSRNGFERARSWKSVEGNK